MGVGMAIRYPGNNGPRYDMIRPGPRIRFNGADDAVAVDPHQHPVGPAIRQPHAVYQVADVLKVRGFVFGW